MIRYTAMALSVVIGLLVSAPAVFAQMDKLKQSTPQERAKIQTDMMKAKLGLSPDQLTKVAAINEVRAADAADHPELRGPLHADAPDARGQHGQGG